MDGSRWQGLTRPVLTGSTFDDVPFQIALSSDSAFDRGASAGIYKGELLASESLVVAVKVFNMLGPMQKELLVRELRAARQVAMRHPLILAFLGTADAGDQRAIVSLYMRNGNLMEYLKAHPGWDKKPLILQVAEGVNYLHSVERLVHGDLKCANVLVSDYGEALLADFGLSTFLEKSQDARATMTGIRQLHTARFVAPEILSYGSDPCAKTASKTCESDVYAFGMLVLEAITEELPWSGVLPNDIAVILNVSAGKHPPQPTSGGFVSISHTWWDICVRCWTRDPEDRPPMHAILRALEETDLKPHRRLSGHTHIVTSVAYLPSGRRVVSGSSDGSIRIWDTISGRTVIGPLLGHERAVLCVAVSPDGLKICSGSLDCTLRRWDSESGAAIGGPMSGHSTLVNSVAFSPDGRHIVSSSDDDSVRRWDACTGEAFDTLLEGGSTFHGANSVAFSPDGTLIAAGSEFDAVRLWDGISGTLLAHLKNPWSRVFAVCFSPDRIHLVTGSTDGTLEIWNVVTRQLERTINTHSGRVRSVAVSPSGRHIASGSEDHTIRIWDALTGVAVGDPLTGHTNGVRSVAFSPDGRSLVSGSRDETVRIWDIFE